MTSDNLDTLRDYLGADVAGQWSDDELERAYVAEQTDQATRCRLPAGALPAALLEALHRRVARNLAMRKAPLGISLSGDGVDVVRVGSRDPEIRRLEAPWRRLTVG